MTSGMVKALMEELKIGLVPLYGERLKGVYLYGSYARGEADEESDVDVLVVLDGFEQYGREIDRTGQLGADLSLKYGVSISKVFIRERDWLRGESPFLANVREEAILA
jgi:type I restriction enzyme S subunit